MSQATLAGHTTVDVDVHTEIDLTQTQDFDSQDENKDNHDNNKDSSLDIRSQQRDIALLQKKFTDKLAFFYAAHHADKELGKMLSGDRRKKLWKEILDLYLSMNDARAIHVYNEEKNGRS